MIEIFFILLQLFIIYFFLSFNVSVLNYKSILLKNSSVPENIAFNSIIFLNFILIISFLNLSLNKIVLSYSFYLGVLVIFYLYKYKSLYISIKDNLFYISLLLITSFVIFLEVANNLVIGWDAQKFWIYKTLNFYNGNTISNLSNLQNPWYPYLGSLSWSFFWKVSFIENEYSGRLFYVFLYLTSLLLLIRNFNFSKFYKTIFYIALIIISYDYSHHSHWSMFSGYQEILIFSLVAMAMHFLYKISEKNKKLNNLNILKILLICNLLIWTKHEGFVISLALILTLVIFFNFSLNTKISIFVFFLIIVFLRFFIFEFYDLNPTNVQHAGYDDINLFTIIDKISLERILLILKFLLFGLISNYFILIGFLTLTFMLFTNRNFKKINYVIFFLFFNIFIFCGIYLITDTDLKHMLETGIDRIIFQFSPAAILIFIESYNLKKINFKKFNL
jgi:hypothetical protein